MEVSVTLFGGLRQFLPAGSSFNKCSLPLEEGEHLDSLLARLPIPENKQYIVIINDEKISREEYADTPVQSDDEVVLLPPIKGG